MRSSRKQVSAASHAIPEVRFADHDLTSFGGLVVFQAFLQRVDMRARLRSSLRHLSSTAAYDFSRVVLILIVHTLLGWRRLRDLDYYRDDPLVLRVLGLRRMPDVSTRHAGRLVITFAKGGDTESEIRRLLEPWGRAAA
jgi:hypothetical protein